MSVEPRAQTRLFGHAAAAAALARALRAPRAPHAWLIQGPRGVGKATLAWRFVRSLLAGTAAPDLALDPQHPVFRQVAGGQHPDLYVLAAERERARSRLHIRIDKVRELLPRLRETAFGGGPRVLLVDAADDLGLGRAGSANALLKLVEEPPPRLTVVLLAHRPGAVPRTLASRCARLPLRPLPDALLEEALSALRPELDAATARILAGFARGSIGRALSIHESGWLEGYHGLLATLGGGRAGVAEAQAAADLLSERFPQAEDIGPAIELLRTILRRAADGVLGRGPLRPLDADEPRLLSGLARSAPLDRLAGLWDKLGVLAARADALNLDRPHAYLVATSMVLGLGEDPPELSAGGPA